MLHFYRFSAETPPPVPAVGAYEKRPPGRGWPEECPPIRAANSFGWDVLAATDMTFRQTDGKWEVIDPVDFETDWAYSPDNADESGDLDSELDAEPLTQRNAWLWEENQILPHVISDTVFPEIANQVKVSTFLFLRTDPNELLYMTDVPNRTRPFRALSALVDTDWYPASYPWHCVLELDKSATEIRIPAGEPLCRLFTVRRDHYFAREMGVAEFESFFERTQEWLRRYGKGESEGMTDITGQYVKQQQMAKFSVVF